jgi:hypothetical protein
MEQRAIEIDDARMRPGEAMRDEAVDTRPHSLGFRNA